ncbi:MAG: peptidoglycan DD-metalloendopeptidase family protein [Bacteroidales bacterium]|nr:peptidoglycan DD-metalloendopeptidase family protein [Bacteroidales bacterium]MBD5224057.1 peptidoglycan DD-metalloendopeptidase family protein [Bacteroidales bacterium]
MNSRQKFTLLTLTIAMAAPIVTVSASRKNKTTSKARVETAADVKKQQASTQQEIKQTREKIRLNEKEIKSKLSELSQIEQKINTGKVKVEDSRNRVEKLQSEINSLQASINVENRQLEKLRAEYLKAIKQMRSKRKSTSRLAFIFSSRNFNEAMRRMRYLRQFGQWRESRAAEIDKRVADLNKRTEQLSQTKANHDKALAENVAAQADLQKQYAVQDAIVVELKKNGQALREHLAKKQSEANVLKNRVAALIAEEQRKAEADRQARAQAEAKRKAEQEHRRREEQIAARKAEAERKAAEEKKLSEQKLIADNKPDKQKDSKKNSDTKKQSKPKQDSKSKKESKPKSTKPEKGNSGKTNTQKNSQETPTYAEARGRKPRSQGAEKSVETPKAAKTVESAPAAPKSTSGGNFASHKGALPRPVSGTFRITSRFGSNSLPDMPNVTYDNPGIDAEVARGAAVTSVFEGTVSGVYMVAGYGTVIIVNHNGYYTVYGNLGQANVKVGDKVKQGQTLGRAAEDVDNPGHGMVHFEVWKNREKQDPAAWIR